MTPEQMQAKVQHMTKAMDSMLSQSVKVGLPKGEATSAVYDSGETVLEVGAAHEFGYGVPQRSWLRLPFNQRREDIAQTIQDEWSEVVDGKDPEQALGLIGVKARNISVGAFRTGGYGQWEDISETTKELKNSSQILLDTGTLRSSITWVVE